MRIKFKFYAKLTLGSTRLSFGLRSETPNIFKLGSFSPLCSVAGAVDLVVPRGACRLHDIPAGKHPLLLAAVVAVGAPDLDRVANEVLKAEVVIEDAEVTASMVVGSG